MYRYDWKPYVPVAVQRARALKKMEKLQKKGLAIHPVKIEGRKIARTFWGGAWCNHLESFSDYQNRLPRGRTYVRNGSVFHLEIAEGEINALVSGSHLYKVKASIKTLPLRKWKDVKKRCTGQIGSLLELLQGRLSGNVMSVVTNRNNGLFPLPGEINLKCSCPDWAIMCKHVAAVLYGVGARLDEHPELLFLLRGVDHEELISTEIDVNTAAGEIEGSRRRIADDALGAVFGIEISEAVTLPRKKAASKSTMTSRGVMKQKAKRKSNTGGKPTPSQKSSSCAKGISMAASKVRLVTGKAVAALRRELGMSQSQFARLLAVSTPSIGNWEKSPGTLSLQTRTLDAWNAAKRLTKQQAWRKLARKEGRP